MGSRGGPAIIRVHGPGGNNYQNNGGVTCCFFSCCTCFNFEYLKSPQGLLKVLEIILGTFCQSVMIEYGSYAEEIGTAYHSFLTTLSSCLFMCTILLISYVFSVKSYNLIRQSILELLFNAIAAFLYLSSAGYMAFAMKTFLMAMSPFKHRIYSPAMSMVYSLGAVLGCMHLYEAILSYKSFRGYR